MTTQTWTTAVAHASDADFRAWGSELSGKLAAAGLVQTADTGQINWLTVTRPSTNTAGGYEIWRFNDSLQGTAPIFIKIEYGTGSNAAYPQIWATVGTGSNGAGTLTGTVSARDAVVSNYASGAGNYPSYLCVAAGHFGLAWKLGAMSSNSGAGLFVVVRTHDTAGAPTATGALVYWGTTSGASGTAIVSAQSLRFAASAEVYAATTAYSFVPGQVTSSVVGADPQVYAHFGISPAVWTVPTMATVLVSEIPQFSSFPVAMVGSTPRTLLSLSSWFKPVYPSVGPGTYLTYGFAMLYE